MNWNWNWKQKSYWLRVNELELVPFQFLYPQSLGLASCFEPLVIQSHRFSVLKCSQPPLQATTALARRARERECVFYSRGRFLYTTPHSIFLVLALLSGFSLASLSAVRMRGIKRHRENGYADREWG